MPRSLHPTSPSLFSSIKTVVGPIKTCASIKKGWTTNRRDSLRDVILTPDTFPNSLLFNSNSTPKVFDDDVI